MRFTAETRGCLKSKISPRLTGGRTTYVCTNEFIGMDVYITKISEIPKVLFSANQVHFHF